MRTLKIATIVLIAACTLQAPAGEITGTVKWEGPPPPRRALKMDADPVCLEKNSGAEVLSESIIVGENGGLANVYVHVISGLPEKTYDTPKEAATLDQKGCLYLPHVLGVMVDQPVKFVNSDGILHNVNVQAENNRGFNLGMPKGTTEAEKTFSREEYMVGLKCNVHPWMTAYIAVSSHPFFAVTGEDGSYKITGLPPGTYELEAWQEHKRLGTQTAKVTIGADGASQTVNFTYSKDQKK